MLIFVITIVFEVAFAIYCIKTRSYQMKVRSIIRIAAFTGFVLLFVLSVIDWSFRYYTLAALLILLAVIGVVALIRKGVEKRIYKTVRVVLKALAMTMLIFVATLPAILFPQYKLLETTGEYQAATVTYLYKDTSRIETYTGTGENRTLNVEMYYPKKADGMYPLIVFSHGAFGTKSSNESLYNELASHGYVVCSIDHTYQWLIPTLTDTES